MSTSCRSPAIGTRDRPRGCTRSERSRSLTARGPERMGPPVKLIQHVPGSHIEEIEIAERLAFLETAR